MPATATAKLMEDARALQAAVAELVRVYQVRDRDRICCHDISVTQCHALEVLVSRGPMRAQALAEALRLDKSTVTRVVDALVRKAYAERLADPDDARAQSLRATPSGRGLFKRIHEEMVQQQAALLGDLGPDVRAGATELIQRLARAAQQRFMPGQCSPSACGPGEAGPGCG
jgi:DNA-binding MarR family transcriptional regulator